MGLKFRNLSHETKRVATQKTKKKSTVGGHDGSEDQRFAVRIRLNSGGCTTRIFVAHWSIEISVEVTRLIFIKNIDQNLLLSSIKYIY